MFVINANSTQTLSINISDEYSLDYFLFALSGNGLTTQKLFFFDAILTNVPRCVGFSITENATEDLTTGGKKLVLEQMHSKFLGHHLLELLSNSAW